MTAPYSRIHLVPETGSTNADLRAQAANWPEGDWLRAERQTAGRGRLGREWRSPDGNLYASTLIGLRPGDPPVTGLGLMLGVAVHAALSNLLPAAALHLKWPNDVMCGPAKLSGMLLEREGDCIVAGVGINVTQAPMLSDRPTIALADLPGGSGMTARHVLEALVPAVDHWLALWRAGGTSAITKAWLPRAHPVGTRLTVSTGTDRPQTGHFLGLDPDGALILGHDDGTESLVHSGDVGIL
ncbi:biotin--[acetyl-CoA-carboxylase] ligase [Sphingobium nicotianae]|uniref:Biotin--[acetyl-CoA-carboxylase] ligase n=1 Tax=Sphingobium nicotianae TaxID=2782607 RepID=A0A9X1AJT1_9SPHN|nr:biotin--[acetyl-CoA-carboxylase] ligase [Sphingobium nicotianae]MBT2185498.1 biotin--[acetyl-CoA-carboxylase] ligase [Sphingobium nicotianae]